MGGQVVPRVDDSGELVSKPSIIEAQARNIFRAYQVISFNNRAMYLVGEPFPHYIPFTKERFDKVAYNLMPGLGRSRVSDIFADVCNRAEDLTHNGHLILFGDRERLVDEKTQRAVVWDSELVSATGYEPELCVWRSPYCQYKAEAYDGPIEFVMQLAGGDADLYDDIMQSLAPIVMDKKPDGVVWWIGDGANGKSTLMDAIYHIFPGQLSSLTVKNITDGRDTPNLNGNLANVVKESSEGRIEDTQNYKSIGTHEDFTVHKFHSQEPITIKGNMHHIFSGNSIPVFNDKGFSARRRTFIIPFNERFVSDPGFEARTFTDEFFSRLVTEICVYAKRIKDQGYRYKWSAKTLGAKAEYDTEANNAENYAAELIREGVVGFDNFASIRMDYENWCREEGQVPLGVGNMRHALQTAGFERISVRQGDGTSKAYRLPNFSESALEQLSMGRPGLFTIQGFRVKPPVVIPDFKPQETSSIIGSKW